MKTEDFEQLDRLMDSMRTHLGHRCCIVNGPHDGIIIAIYDNGTGEKIKDAISYNTEDCVKKILTSK